ncbi:hypothetical protein E4U17_002842 [Claviceps sp. LM77 group G4]|nr:hypothetical protein E4U17_002842 [Claviceps sp. LM77 group G4]KAG6069724.1 hypothetical protein E4U33_004653 [Claviceps sp. LM78 group G4]KAG6076078.1 hypothetical protein E4U16_002998 [Claviceps sp. LM84 group G4]
MARKSIPVMEWAMAHHSVVFDDEYDPTKPSRTARRRSSRSSQPAPREQRFRSLSLSLPWKKPKHSMYGHDDSRSLAQQMRDMAMDDTREDGSAGHPGGQGSSYRGHHTPHGSIKGMIRRASMSLKGFVHRRPSLAMEHTIREQCSHDERPTTSYGSWSSQPKHATGVDHFGPQFDQGTQHFGAHRRYFPVPGLGDEPPVIPRHTGAAAKASAAMQNEFLARQRWLNAASSEDGYDGESGIGIAVTQSPINYDSAEYDSMFVQDPNISRIDFISLLPTELAINILSHLDAAALANSSCVSQQWHNITLNSHIWRESCLREMTTTYAMSRPIQPDTGLGIPKIHPSVDWKKVYQTTMELSRRWKEGKAQAVYLNGHTDSIYCLQFDEFKIISGSRDQTIRIWDMQTLECRLVIGPPGVINGSHLLQDASGNEMHYATGSTNDGRAPSIPNTVSFSEYHQASILCLQYDDDILVTGSSDATCIVYDVKAGYKPLRRLRHHAAAVLDLAFDKKHIVTCSKDSTICVWDRETGALLRQLRGHAGPVNAVQMRGNTVVSCSGDLKVKLWNIDTGKNIREFSGHTKGLACSQFSEDGRFVVSAGNDKMIRIWDANTGECLREMKAHQDLVRSLHIDSVSGRLISGSYDSDIKVWDMETGRQLLDFPSWHASWVLSAKCDYRRIVSTGQDPKILIMDFGAHVEGVEELKSTMLS